MKQYLYAIFAAVISFLVFLFCIYLVAPVAEEVFLWYGKWFIPANLGGGREAAEDPGFITLLVRGILASALSGYAAFKTGEKLFSSKHELTYEVLFGILILIYVSIFTIVFFHNHDAVEALIVFITLSFAFYPLVASRL